MPRHGTRSSLRTLAVCSLLAIFDAPAADAVPGDLDTSLGGFGTDGRIYSVGFTVNAVAIDQQGRLLLAGGLNGAFHLQRRSGPRFLTVESAGTFISGDEQSSVARAVAIAPDGKIVLAGTIVQSDGQHDFAVVRFNDDLTLDENFAGDGTQNSDFDGHADDAFAVAVQDDLKVVVAGAAVIEGLIYTDVDWGVERFNENGTLDDGFNGNGKWTFDSEATDNAARALAIQDDGKILVAGDVYTGNLGGNHDFSVIRLASNGAEDGDFGDDGRRDIGFGDDEGANAIALDPFNGSIVLAGGDYFAEEQFKIARVLSDGTPDGSFDGDGQLVAPIDGKATAYGVFVQPDHRTVVAGRAFLVDDPDKFISMRFNGDGSLDPTFGDAGKVFTQFGATSTGAAALALQANGSLVAAGGGQATRYRAEGSLDAGGVVDILFDPTHVGSEATALAVDADGKLVAAGKAYLTDYDMTLARYQPSYGNGLDTTFGTGFPQTGRSLFGIGGTLETRAMAIRADGKIVVGGQSFFNDFDFLVARFNTDGTPDPSCSGIGLRTVNFEVGDDSVAAVIVAGDRTYAGGTVRGATNSDFALVRLNDVCAIDDAGGPAANEYKFQFDLGGEDVLGGMVLQGAAFVLAGTSAGDVVLVRSRQSVITGSVSLDPGFGTAGRATLDLGDGETVTGLGQQADGKLVVSGSVNQGGGSNFFVARLSAGGVLDENFGIGGIAFASFNAVDNAQALAVRADGTIAVAGCTTTASGQVFAVAQFTPDGSLDSEFSDDGKVTLRVGPSGEECAQAATFFGPDRLVVGGYASSFGIRNFVLAAFDSIVTTTTSTLGPTTTTLPASVCGDKNGDEAVTATDALGVLRTAVGLDSCELCVCDVDGSGAVAASDALAVLRVAVGQPVPLDCPAC